MNTISEKDLLEICAIAARSGRLLSSTLIDWLHTSGMHELAVRASTALAEQGEYVERDTELVHLRHLIADAARVVLDKGYSEDAFDALVNEARHWEYADLCDWLEDDERYGMAHRMDPDALTTAELHELGIETCDDPNCVPF